RPMDSGLSFREPRNDGAEGLRQISPTGKILFYRIPKSVARIVHPALLGRASAVVTDVGRGAVDADVATDDARQKRTARSCGPGARRRHQAAGEARAEPAVTESTQNSSPGRARYKP